MHGPQGKRGQSLCWAETWGRKRAEADIIQGVNVTYGWEGGQGQSWEGCIMTQGVKGWRSGGQVSAVTTSKGRAWRSESFPAGVAQRASRRFALTSWSNGYECEWLRSQFTLGHGENPIKRKPINQKRWLIKHKYTLTWSTLSDWLPAWPTFLADAQRENRLLINHSQREHILLRMQ